MSYTEQLKQKFFSLPKSLQDAVRSEANNAYLVEVAQKYMLNEEQQMELIHDAAYVVLGEHSRDSFASRLVEIEGVGEKPAQAMAKMIDDRIFTPLTVDIADAASRSIAQSATTAVAKENVEDGSDSESTQEVASEEDVIIPITSAHSEQDDSAEEEIPAQAPKEDVEAPAFEQETEKVENDPEEEDENVITIPTITITKPPRFIPLKDLKQGSIRMRPAPEGIPSRQDSPVFPRPAPNAIHTLKNDITSPPKPPAPTPHVLPRIEPTPEGLASKIPPRAELKVPVPHKPTPSSNTAPTSSGDPYRESIDSK